LGFGCRIRSGGRSGGLDRGGRGECVGCADSLVRLRCSSAWVVPSWQATFRQWIWRLGVWGGGVAPGIAGPVGEAAEGLNPCVKR